MQKCTQHAYEHRVATASSSSTVIGGQSVSDQCDPHRPSACLRQGMKASCLNVRDIDHDDTVLLEFNLR